jgi:hypothetical protein
MPFLFLMALPILDVTFSRGRITCGPLFRPCTGVRGFYAVDPNELNDSTILCYFLEECKKVAPRYHICGAQERFSVSRSLHYLSSSRALNMSTMALRVLRALVIPNG